MTKRLAGKVAVITGGASGIGRECSLRFAEEGAKIVVADINLDRASSVCAEIKAAGNEAVPFAVDASIPEDVVAMADAAMNEFGQVDACGSTFFPKEGNSIKTKNPDASI